MWWFLQKLSLPKSSPWTLVLWKMFIFLISVITFLNLSKVKAKYEKGKISVPGELRLTWWNIKSMLFPAGSSEVIGRVAGVRWMSHFAIRIGTRVWPLFVRYVRICPSGLRLGENSSVRRRWVRSSQFSVFPSTTPTDRANELKNFSPTKA